MIVLSRRKLAVFLFFVSLAALGAVFSPQKNVGVFNSTPTNRIIVDAGHGFPDGGAIGISGTIESTINLKIATFTEKLLKKKGYTVIMTRKGDDALSSEGKTISEKKHNDMYKRLDILKNSNADMFVSIHINKFTDSRYNGAQVIYSENFVQSERLASYIQGELHMLDGNKTRRQEAAAPKNIFLLKNATIPAVIVECGFLSNFSEEQLLLTEKYQKEVAEAIVSGIEKYYSSEKEQNNNESIRNG